MSLLGVDVGSTGMKARAISLAGEVVGEAALAYSAESRRAGQLDPEALWDAFAAVVARAAAQAAGRGDRVAALAISTFGHGLLAVDAALRPLSGVLLGIRQRLSDRFASLHSLVPPAERFAATGQPHSHLATVNKVLWLREREPDAWRRTALLLGPGEFLQCRLGARPAMSPAHAAHFGVFDSARGAWWEAACARLELDPAQWPEVVPAGEALGRVSAAAAAELGLDDEVVVVNGEFDQICALLGAGAGGATEALVNFGTVASLSVPIPPGARRHEAVVDRYSIYAVPGLGDVAMAWHLGSGGSLEWLRDQALQGAAAVDAPPVAERVAAALARPGRGLLFLPYFNGAGNPHMVPGLRGGVFGLDPSVEWLDLLRAALESGALELSLMLEPLRRAGAQPEAVLASGGGSRSPEWMQLCASALGIEVAPLADAETGSIGAAMLAGMGAGLLTAGEARRLAPGRKRALAPDA
ncbi:MAG TPA: FGGY family carbohydrate kinase, partial [Limnochordia bacterium]|nr:FGGY family carbohydrate kinase [Limnochordia bacterium]